MLGSGGAGQGLAGLADCGWVIEVFGSVGDMLMWGEWNT